MGYKFLFEIKGKFPSIDMTAYSNAVANFFYALPICVRIDRNILVVHGGVPVAADPVARPPSMSPYDTAPL